MWKSLFAAVALMCAIGGTANAATVGYQFVLTVGADSTAFGGLTAGDTFLGTVDLDPSFPNLVSGDGSLTNLLVRAFHGHSESRGIPITFFL